MEVVCRHQFLIIDIVTDHVVAGRRICVHHEHLLLGVLLLRVLHEATDSLLLAHRVVRADRFGGQSRVRLHIAVSIVGRRLVIETSLLRRLVLLTKVGRCMGLFSAHTVGNSPVLASIQILFFVLLLLLHHHLMLLHHLQVGLTIQIVHL